MNHKGLISNIAAKSGMATAQIESMVEETIKAITQSLESNDTIMISGFGTFEVRKKMERISYNPVTKERVLVPPKLALAFKPGEILKDVVDKSTETK